MQQASYLDGGPLLWILPLYLHVNQKSEDDDEYKSHPLNTVKILKFGTPQTIAIIVLKIEKFDVTLH